MTYTIGEVANMFNESTYTLRYYDKEGILPFMQRDKNGHRILQETDLRFFRIIQSLKMINMPLKDIATFIKLCMEGKKTISARKKLLAKRQEEAQKELLAAQAVYDKVQNYSVEYIIK